MLAGAKVFVLDDFGRVLVIRRSKTDPRRPLTWDIPGGVVESDEDPGVAAVREVWEETGISLEGVKLIEANLGDEIELYIYRSNSSHTNVSLSFEHDQHLWVTLAEFQELDIPGKYKLAAKRALG
jgi:8-oxo-dGTP pyrophosphatase MutT (NUDIX family)